MKRLTVDVNEEEYNYLLRIAECYNTDVKSLLGVFVQDLRSSDRSGGSDERHLQVNGLVARYVTDKMGSECK